MGLPPSSKRRLAMYSKKRQEKLATLRNTFAYKSIDLFLCGAEQSACVSPKTV